MKKISIIMALGLLLGVSFTSCKQDTQPRLGEPTEFVLNVPPLADQTYILSADNGVDLTVSQPNYGLGVVTNYQTQISFVNDFENSDNYRNIESVSTSAQISISGEEFAQAMCQLMGYVDNDTEDLFSADARTVYVRVRAYVTNADYSEIYSNVIELTVKPYKAVKLPARLYVIGQVNGWDINDGSFYVEEPSNGVGDNVYYGTVSFTADQASSGFRFYQSLGTWGDDGSLPSIGANANDGDNASVQVNDEGVYSGACVIGKGNWNITNWPGGDMKITVDLNTMKVIFETVE